MRQISHDPFARTSLLSETIMVSSKDDRMWRTQTCDWCGQEPARRKDGSIRLYAYYVERDDRPGKDPIKGKFCCVGCMRAYHNVV